MNTSRERYLSRIYQVQHFIQQHLDSELSLERLAEIAGYSPCHFHRVFRGVVGESADDYVRRLRMKRAAYALRQRSQTILEIALDAGYGSHEAFTRAFTRLFSMTPSEYQSLEHPLPVIKELAMGTSTYTPDHIRIEHQPARRMAYLRVIGEYNHENLNPAFGRIIGWAIAHHAMTPETLCLGVYHDDPEVTPPEKQRADVGITVNEAFQPSDDVQVQTIPAGTCAVLRHKGHYNTLGDAYRWLYSAWLPDSGHTVGDTPPYEVYINDASELPPEEWLTDICIPLREER